MSIKLYQEKFKKVNFVEVIGMPASGKSTLINKLYINKEKGYDVNGNLPRNKVMRLLLRSAYSFLALIHSPKEMIHDLKIIVSSRQNSKKDLVSVSLNWMYITYMCNYMKPKKHILYVWDQGVFQAIWSIIFSSQESIDYIDLLKNKNLPDKIYFTDADDDVLLRRSIERKVSIRLDYKNEEHVAKGRHALDKIKVLLIRLGFRKYDDIYKLEKRYEE